MSVQHKARKSVLIIAAFAVLGSGLVISEASAAGYSVGDTAKTANFPGWDRLNIRKWPANDSRKVAEIRRGRTVFVERCIIKAGADWCKVQKGWKYGWVNGKFLRKGGHTFAHPHPWY